MPRRGDAPARSASGRPGRSTRAPIPTAPRASLARARRDAVRTTRTEARSHRKAGPGNVSWARPTTRHPGSGSASFRVQPAEPTNGDGMTSKFDRVAPVLPVRVLRKALEHYRRLGFTADAYEETKGGDPIYGFLHRGGVDLHLARVPDLKIEQNTSVC